MKKWRMPNRGLELCLEIKRATIDTWGDAVFVVVKLGIALVLLISALEKIRSPHQFLASVYDYNVLSLELGLFVGVTLPWAEFLLGCALMCGAYDVFFLFVSSTLFVLFSAIQFSAIYRGLAIGCGCFGTGDSHQVDYWTLLRTAMVCCAAFAAYVYALKASRAPKLAEFEARA